MESWRRFAPGKEAWIDALLDRGAIVHPWRARCTARSPMAWTPPWLWRRAWPWRAVAPTRTPSPRRSPTAGSATEPFSAGWPTPGSSAWWGDDPARWSLPTGGGGACRLTPPCTGWLSPRPAGRFHFSAVCSRTPRAPSSATSTSSARCSKTASERILRSLGPPPGSCSSQRGGLNSCEPEGSISPWSEGP